MRRNPNGGVGSGEVSSAAKTVTYIGVSLLILLVIASSIAGLTGGPVSATDYPAEITGGQFSQINPDADIESVSNVQMSTGSGVRLTGANDSYWQSTENVKIAQDDTWTVCTWASVDADSENETMAALSANGRAIIQYNGSTNNWVGWYYDDGSTNSYAVEVAASGQPGNYSQVCLVHASDQLTIYQNATPGESTATTGENIADVNTSASNWDGRLDETRTYDDGLNATQRNQSFNNPVEPLPNTNRTARIYFDRGMGDTAWIFFAPGNAELSNHTWATGLTGVDLTRNVDYSISSQSESIKVFQSSDAYEAPAVWLDYSGTSRPIMSDSIGIISSVVVLAAILGIVVFAMVVLRQINDPTDNNRRRRR